jgi:CheY-like chemotaxis protein
MKIEVARLTPSPRLLVPARRVEPMLRILLVEDDPHIATITCDLLEYYGYRVTVAEDGRHALDIVPRESPDVIITDFMMPGMSGLEMIQELRDTGYRRPIIMCSAVSESEFPLHHAHYDRFLQKPYDMRALIEAVETSCGERRSHGLG